MKLSKYAFLFFQQLKLVKKNKPVHKSKEQIDRQTASPLGTNAGYVCPMQLAVVQQI